MKKLLLFVTLAALAMGQGKPHVYPIKGKTLMQSHPPPKMNLVQRLMAKFQRHRGISYHGGPVMLGVVRSHVIFYGNWSMVSPAVPITTDLFKNAGGSPYEGVNTTYYNGSNFHINGLISLGIVIYDSYSHGKTLSDADVWAVVSSHIGTDLPLSGNDMYFLITSDDVAETSGFGSQYCGWHTSAVLNQVTIKYAFIGDPVPMYVNGCADQATGPNGSSGGDAMASIILHELNEAASDPEGTGWYFNQTGNENEDQCAWTFGTMYRTVNGAMANMKLGARDFLIQQNWRNSIGPCALK